MAVALYARVSTVRQAEKTRARKTFQTAFWLPWRSVEAKAHWLTESHK